MPLKEEGISDFLKIIRTSFLKEDAKKHMKTTPAQFVRQVKQEVSKITWPTRQETMQGAITVIVMSVVLAFFLLIVDSIFAFAIRFFIG